MNKSITACTVAITLTAALFSSCSRQTLNGTAGNGTTQGTASLQNGATTMAGYQSVALYEKALKAERKRAEKQEKKDAPRRAEILFETSMGNFTMQLYNETPLHRDAYLTLTRCGFFDGLLFHRVINNFVVQGGDPTSRNAKPGEMLGDGEPFRIPAEIHFPRFHHVRGMVNAAREGDDTNPKRESCGSQFAIMTHGPLTDQQILRGQDRIWQGTDSTVCLTPMMIDDYKKTGGSPHLDAQYTIFAHITDGMDVVDRIQKVAVDKNDRPLTDVRIIKATVIRNYK